MGKYRVIIKPTAEKDLSKHKKAGSISSIKKILKILAELQEHPRSGTENPEELKYELKGFWSRRINKKDRIIYEIQEDIVTVYILSAIDHYE